MGERSLILFTLLGQAAAGALVGLAGVQLLGNVDVLGFVAFAAVGTVLLIAAGISTAHLGSPAHAPHAIRNWRSSWLSREILALALTGGLVALGALVALLADPAASHGARTVIGVLAAASGILLVLAMVQLYSVRTIPEWRPALTGARFGGTTLRLGGIGAGILVAIEALRGSAIDASALWLVALLAGGLALELSARRLAGTRDTTSAGSLLVRGVPSTQDERDPAQLVAGLGIAALGIALLITSTPLLAMALLVVGALLTSGFEMTLRAHFYELAPLQGRTAAQATKARRAGQTRA